MSSIRQSLLDPRSVRRCRFLHHLAMEVIHPRPEIIVTTASSRRSSVIVPRSIMAGSRASTMWMVEWPVKWIHIASQQLPCTLVSQQATKHLPPCRLTLQGKWCRTMRRFVFLTLPFAGFGKFCELTPVDRCTQACKPQRACKHQPACRDQPPCLRSPILPVKADLASSSRLLWGN